MQAGDASGAYSSPEPVAARRRSSATTAGSARVVVSPRSRPSATSLNSRRMILPERVFGRSSVKMMTRGRAIAPIFSTTCARRTSRVLVADFQAVLQGDEGDDHLPGRGVVGTDHRRLCHARMVDERGLHLSRGNAVARHVHDVVDPPQQPEVPVIVDLGPVACEVTTLETAPVSLAVPLAGRRRCPATWPARAA